MTNPEIRRTQRPATEKEREKLQRYHEQIAEDVPDLRRQALQSEAVQREAAMREPTVSGQLRRAIANSGMDHRELARQTGLSPKTLADFLVGAASLDSPAIDKLAALLNQQLKPVR